MAGGDLTDAEFLAITITERITSGLSLLGFIFVIWTYLFCAGFKKPVNRLIFYAQWSNLGATIVGFISRDAVTEGTNAPLCQFQAFLFQMFGGVDVYWSLCMSLNVYLALFHGWNAKRMQKAEWKYLVGCYGFSLVPAVVYLFLKTEDRGRVYGPAILWCWITPGWSFLRLATMYVIVWVALLGALVIYCMALKKAWSHRRALAGLLNPLNENPFAGTITTEIEVVFSDSEGAQNDHHIALNSRFDELGVQEEGGKKMPYNVVVQGKEGRKDSRTRPDLLRLPTLTRNAAMAEENAEAWLYARVAFLYFLAMIICWIPASINRLVALILPENDVIFGLNYVAILGLPLQGFLNALVYYVSSQTAVKNVILRLTKGRRTSARSTKDAQRIRDSYAPSERQAHGGVIFHDDHLKRSSTTPLGSQPAGASLRGYGDHLPATAKTATASVESVSTGSRTVSAQTGANMF